MAPDRIVVDPARVVREIPAGWLGINVNYFLDDDRNTAAQHGGHPARPISAALREMGVKRIRYPGGDKSDSHLWSVPPFDRPRPTLVQFGTGKWVSGKRDFVNEDGSWKAVPLDFDAFIALCREVGAEPVCVVCFDCMYAKPREDWGPPPKALLLETAVAWVRYANVVKGYGVRDWEIGNESYLGKGAGPTAAQYAQDAGEFARAMKAVDPSIRIGINGWGRADTVGDADRTLGTPEAWWATVIPRTVRDIDYLVAHSYPCWAWKSYARYPVHTTDFAGEATAVEGAIGLLCSPADAARLSISMSEVNTIDWAPEGEKWPNVNDLGHGLVLAEIIGRFLGHSRVENFLVWNTRWFGGEDPPSVCNALDRRNGLRPTGRAVAIWNRFMGNRLLATEGTAMVPAFATTAPGAVNVLLINKGLEARQAEVEVAKAAAGPVNRWTWTGSSPGDFSPVFAQAAPVSCGGGEVAVELPPVSLTVLEVPIR